MLNLIKLGVLDSILLVLKPKPQTEPQYSKSETSLEPIWHIAVFWTPYLFSLPYYLAKNNMHSSTMHEKRTTYTCFFSAIFLESSSRVFLHTSPRYAYFFKYQAHEIELALILVIFHTTSKIMGFMY